MTHNTESMALNEEHDVARQEQAHSVKASRIPKDVMPNPEPEFNP